MAAARSEGTATDLFEESFGAFLGLNRTDGRCVDIVQRFGRLTLGQLAEEAGLTSGAVTTAVDRLEKADCLVRVRDREDRRKIFVELADAAKQFGQIIYDPISELFSAAMRDLGPEDLTVIARYLELSARVHRDHAELVQTFTLPADASLQQRLDLAVAYNDKAKALVDPIIEDWRNGKLPDNAFVSGKIHFDD